jgi:tRNA threonylcarbamoyladenosine biosynthesis protein TsaE
MKIIETHSPEETYRLGRTLGQEARPGQIFALDGDLGCGKTVFTQGFAAGLGITEPVTSPTFTILQSYHEGRLPLHHFDVYRIVDEDEMDEIGYEDCFYGDGVSLVEWAVQIEDLLPPETLHIRIQKDTEKGFDYRLITISKGEEDEPDRT